MKKLSNYSISNSTAVLKISHQHKSLLQSSKIFVSPSNVFMTEMSCLSLIYYTMLLSNDYSTFPNYILY